MPQTIKGHSRDVIVEVGWRVKFGSVVFHKACQMHIGNDGLFSSHSRVSFHGAASVVWWLACWPLVPKLAGSTPAEAVGFFSCEKILSMPSFGGEVKPWVPCCSFAACKKILQSPWKLHCRLNLIGHFSPIIPPFGDRGLSCRLTWSASGDYGENWKRCTKGPFLKA
jgi:hypothetical protein